MAEGVVLATGACWACGIPFWFDADRVTSIPIDPVTGKPPDQGGDAARAVKQPLCNSCIDRINTMREVAGQPLWPRNTEYGPPAAGAAVN